MQTIPKSQRLIASDRYLLGLELERRYKAGATIRELCRETGRSYGSVHRMLADAGVDLRPRGGPNYTAKKKVPAKKTTKKTAAKKRT